MPRASIIRAGPSRSQAQPSQVDRRRAGPEEDEAESSEDGSFVQPTQGGGRGGRGGGGADGGTGRSAADRAKNAMGQNMFNKKVYSLIRLLLFHTHTHTPLRRDDINKQVLGDKNFYPVFPLLMSEAIERLKEGFGMEVVELRGKSGDMPVGVVEGLGLEVQQKRKGKRRQGQENDDLEEESVQPASTAASAKKATTKSYILRSSLPTKLLPLLCIPQQIFCSIHEIELPTNRQRTQDRTEGGGGAERELPDEPGTILDWQHGVSGVGGGVAFQGLLWVILGMILVNDRVLNEKFLHTLFETHFQISPETILPFSSKKATTSATSRPTLATFLGALTKQGYLEKVKGDRDPSIALVGAPALWEGRVEWEYRWGARSEAEIGERAVGEFMAEIYETHAAAQADDEQEDNDEVAQPGPSRGRNNRNDNNNNGDRTDISDSAPKLTPAERRLDLLRRVEIASGGKLGGITAAVDT